MLSKISYFLIWFWPFYNMRAINYFRLWNFIKSLFLCSLQFKVVPNFGTTFASLFYPPLFTIWTHIICTFFNSIFLNSLIIADQSECLRSWDLVQSDLDRRHPENLRLSYYKVATIVEWKGKFLLLSHFQAFLTDESILISSFPNPCVISSDVWETGDCNSCWNEVPKILDI